MSKLKVVSSGITLAAPLRVYLGKDENSDETGKPFGHCALYAVMPDRNQPFTEFELHYCGGMGNKIDRGNTQLVNGLITFSAENLVQANNENNSKKLTDLMPEFLANVAVKVQKQILCEMNNADFLTNDEYELYSSWIRLHTNSSCLLEQSDDMKIEDEPNYIHGSYLISDVAYKLTASILSPLFLGE